MRQDKIHINIIQNTAIVKTAHFDNKQKAKQFYHNNSENKWQYTQLVVNNRPYTTAEAEHYFKGVEYKVRSIRI